MLADNNTNKRFYVYRLLHLCNYYLVTVYMCNVDLLYVAMYSSLEYFIVKHSLVRLHCTEQDKVVIQK